MILPKKSVQDGKKLGKTIDLFVFLLRLTVRLSSDDVKKRYEQKAGVEKQKYEQLVADYKKNGGGAASGSPAKGKAASKGGASKKSPKKPAGKKTAAKAPSSDEDNDDDEDDDDEEDEE